MQREKDVTIYDIAKALKISPGTVSRGLKDHSSISVKTKKKITDKARELGYRSNNFASNLRTSRTNTIGVLVHELNSNFMVNVLAGIEQVLADTEYDIIIAHSAESAQKEVTNANNLFHKRVDGLIASLASDTADLSHFNQFTDKKIPVIFFDRVEENAAGTKVIIDNFRAGYDVTSHLISQGCKRIVHLTGNLSRNVYLKRFQGYQAALEDHNVRYDEKLLMVTDLKQASSVQAAKDIMKLKPMPDGLFATGDFAAAVCIQTFKENGLSVPADIAVAGFNNDTISTIIEPKLTTVNYSGISIGETAARMLVSHLTGNANINLTSTVVMNAELIIRASSLM